MPLYIEQSGDVDRCHGSLTDWQTLKDRVTQLLIKYKSGALVTQYALKENKDSSEGIPTLCLTRICRGKIMAITNSNGDLCDNSTKHEQQSIWFTIIGIPTWSNSHHQYCVLQYMMFWRWLLFPGRVDVLRGNLQDQRQIKPVLPMMGNET